MASIISAGTSTGTALNLTGDTSGILQLASNNGTVGLTVTAAQNVGIGSVAPVSKLEVVNTGVATLYIGYNNTSFNYLDADNNIFRSGAGVERMRIDSAGNVGIKISSPTAPLHVNAVPTGYVAKFSGTGVSKFYIAAPAADGGIMDLGALNNAEGALTQIRFNGQLNIGSTGNLGLGNTTPTTSGVGITFPSTQSASSDANTLDDYEEGTWTPVLTFGGIAGVATYTQQNGTYTKIGNVVTVRAYISIGTKSAATGGAGLTGLPFNTAGVAVNYSCAFAYFSGQLITGSFMCYIGGGTTGVNLGQTNGTSGFIGLNNTNFVNAGDFIFQTTYIAA